MRFGFIAFSLLAACAAPEIPTSNVDISEEAPQAWSFIEAAPVVRAASCPETVTPVPATPIALNVTPVALGSPEDVAAALPGGVTFAGGWHLTSGDSNFGGLSGLEMTEADDLLAVSDAGAFVSIEMQDGAPSGRGSISYMLGADGNLLSGKDDADAEGLAYRGGVALVSFERNHRIMGFDLAGCQAAARGALIANLPKEVGGRRVKPNNGAEALGLFSQSGRLSFDYEAPKGGKLIDGYVLDNQTAKLRAPSERQDAIGGYSNVGADEQVSVGVGGIIASLARSYDPVRGNRNIIHFSSVLIPAGVQDLTPIELTPPLSMDNFEGIVIASLTKEKMRLYIVSDDNFSAKQRTLLYAFDVALVPAAQ